MPRIRYLSTPMGAEPSAKICRRVLAQWLWVEEHRIRIRKTAAGKPLLMNPRGYSFSISHSQNWFAIVLVKGPLQIGVDIERMRPTKILRISKRFFNRTDDENLRRCRSRKTQLKKFFEIWTIKEACVKSLGSGMFKDMKRIQIYSNGRIRIEGTKRILKYQRLSGLPKNFVGHLVTRSRDRH